ncbi:HEAT repeat-containing protein 1-like [Pollicipes pollicipes]|uniref:HEAT repeat-containing protein 1-like n=1 Tax=Pollicipes pollicipes TaxID=41117 RepID=UPI00188591C2|nr:HEAT repeat-containing protein 1-like [Pollicipes pollicipes]
MNSSSIGICIIIVVTRQLFSALDTEVQPRLLALLVDLCTDTKLSAVSSRVHKQLGEDESAVPEQKTVRQQLALTCLQQTCERLRDAAEPPDEQLQTRFSVDTLVQCVRSSDSPQTHQLALIVLGMAATMLPEMVLHNIMAIFTFMGSSMLRQDNEYSFRVIEKTVESVIPALVQASGLVAAGGEVVVPVLRVFVDAVRDVPRHRRLPLFAHLLRTVGEQSHLWACLVMLSDQLATRGDVKDKMAEDTVTVTGDRSASLLVEFAISLCSEFSLDVQLVSCSRLLEHTETLMGQRHEVGDAPRKGRGARAGAAPAVAADPALFDLDAHTDKQFYKYCHTAVSLIAQLLASEAFVAQSAALDAAGAAAAQAQHQLLLERSVRLITACTRLCQTQLRGRPDALRHVRAILHRLYALLDKINSLLPAAMFLSVVSGLLGSRLTVVRRRAMELLASRLQLQADYFSEADSDALLLLTGELVTAAQAGAENDAEEEEEGGSALNRQTALFALKLLSRLLAARHPAHFVPVLRVVCDLAGDASLPPPLFASCLLCLAELCASLRAHAIGRLPATAAALLAALEDEERRSHELVLVSAVTLAQKLVESLAHFISPYLPALLRHVCRLSAERAGGASSPLQHRLRQTRHHLATAVPLNAVLAELQPLFLRCVPTARADGAAGGERACG